MLVTKCNVKMVIFILLFLIPIFIPTFFLAAQELDVAAILRQIDASNSFQNEDFSAEYTIVSDKPGEERSIFKLRVFRRDTEDKFLLLILDPLLRKGEGYLSVDTASWFYDPESREFAVFNLSDNFQDSESRNSDFTGGNLADNYEVKSYEEGTLGKYPVYILDLEATTDTVAFPTTRLWVRQDNYLLLKVEDYSLSGRLLRTSYFPSYARSGNYYIPTKVLIVDTINAGEKTEISTRNISFNNIPNTVFTRAYLEQVNR